MRGANRISAGTRRWALLAFSLAIACGGALFFEAITLGFHQGVHVGAGLSREGAGDGVRADDQHCGICVALRGAASTFPVPARIRLAPSFFGIVQLPPALALALSDFSPAIPRAPPMVSLFPA
ncbi:MAG: hypothetical protein NDJ90_05070 [Oligoflexia bacterium]|nr:hypothetical protein [Oligoflexia bacterium]